MKKKNYFYLAALSLAMTFSMGACSDNNDPNPDGGGKDPVNLDYSSENASAWGNYMYNVAMLLNDDATMLYNSWRHLLRWRCSTYRFRSFPRYTRAGFGKLRQSGL